MTAPSLIHAARHAPDRRDRIFLLAETMQDHRYGPEGACTVAHARAAGLTLAEIETYWDAAIGVLEKKPSLMRTTPAGRIQGLALAAKARGIHQRIERRAHRG